MHTEYFWRLQHYLGTLQTTTGLLVSSIPKRYYQFEFETLLFVRKKK